MKNIKLISLLVTLGILLWGFTMMADNRKEQLVIQNLAYGQDSIQQAMDVYLVADRTEETPLIILVHGGGWMAGDKKDADFMAEACFANGINVVNINYRLATDQVHYQEMIEDIDAVIALLHEKAGEWSIRTSKIVFWGGSAGAHLSLLYAYNYDQREVVSLVMTLGGPTKLDDKKDMEGAKQSDLEGLFPLITGKPWNDDASLLADEYKLASPYYGKRFVPTFLVHGEKDNIVPPHQALLMQSQLQLHNVADTLVILPNGGHGGENTPSEVADAVNRAMFRWILKYSK